MSQRLRKTFRESSLYRVYKSVAVHGEYWRWKLLGSPADRVPHLVKQRAIVDFGRRFGLKTLVETGTNLGDMIAATRGLFARIYSIELDEWRYQRAVREFARWPHIRIIHGDSGTELERLAAQLSEPALFWLDAHDFEHETPINAELEAIARHPVRGHVLLIDDAKWFVGKGAYPTVEELKRFVAGKLPGNTVEVVDGMIRVYPAGP